MDADEIENTQVKAKFDGYPEEVRARLLHLRRLILETAQDHRTGAVQETLKWGEPSYLTKGGSAVRIDWKAKQPDYYAMYFHCQTKLIDTFRERYGDTLRFEGNRAIVFRLDDPLPEEALRHCVSLSLRYHRLKHLPMLGV